MQVRAHTNALSYCNNIKIFIHLTETLFILYLLYSCIYKYR